MSASKVKVILMTAVTRVIPITLSDSCMRSLFIDSAVVVENGMNSTTNSTVATPFSGTGILKKKEIVIFCVYLLYLPPWLLNTYIS